MCGHHHRQCAPLELLSLKVVSYGPLDAADTRQGHQSVVNVGLQRKSDPPASGFQLDAYTNHVESAVGKQHALADAGWIMDQHLPHVLSNAAV